MGSLTRFPHGVSSFGVPVFGGGPLITTGKFWFVHSGTGNNGNSGKDSDHPFASIDYAMGKCTANKGDIIIVMPGHTETVSSAGLLDLDVAGTMIYGLGAGASRPVINFTTATSADMDVDAASITMVNILFTGGFDALVAPVDVNATDFTMINCEMRDVTGQMTLGILTDANASRLKLRGFVFNGASAAGGDAAVRIVGGDGHVIEDFSIFGNFAVAAIENVTTACTNTTVGGGTGQNFIQNGLDSATPVAITMVSTSTGHIGPNINIRIGVDATSNAANITEAVVGAAMQIHQPINICNLGGEVGMQTNITASTDA